MPILQVRNLRKQFGGLDILKDINVEIDKGDFLVLVGPSGCGKSTLLNCIAGLEPVTSGVISIDGRDMNEVAPKDRDIAMVFQSYALYPTMSVKKNITFGMKVRGVDADTQKAKLKKVAEQLQIETLLDRRPAQLSGGQRQRVAMGRALVRDPKLFLFDEPLSNLDAKLRVGMRNEIKKLHQSLNASMVYVTHDQIEAMTLATKIVVMKEGKVQQIGSPDEIYLTPANLFVADFMGSPAMNLLQAHVKRNGSATELHIERPDNLPLVLIDSARPKLPERVIVGIRPEDISEKPGRTRKNVHVASCKIEVVEPAGADTFVLLNLSNKEATARLKAETKVKPGQKIELAFNMDKVSYFDAESGKRIC